MGPALYVMAVLGCGEGQAPCQQVEVLATRYESREACLAASDGALARLSGVDFPIVVAQCREEAAAAAPLRAADVALPEPDRRASAWDD